ncbi:hypothetical protein RKD26_004444 [Streptomyces calvus]|jgi:hypothetical protein|uniref:hypothetical protein n=1 Tax=Streptomyces calvus TaxID=67282 RepID=UPI0035169CF8
MSGENVTGAGPSPGPRARYFTREGEGVQVVYNLRDAGAYRALGYEETDEATYRASLPDGADGPCLEHVTDREGGQSPS